MSVVQKFPKIVIAGASGYIGQAIIPKLLLKFPNAEITALSRSSHHSDDPRVAWRACDLFSLKILEETLPQEIDLAIYLVHSMGPTAQLDQGSFADYDLILADNFARAVKNFKVRHLIYLGGLIPENLKLSLHLQSRLEVEETFNQFKLPTTFFRAALILGEHGSSFQILLKLVKRLPIMICPSWTQTLTTPVDLTTVLQAILECSLQEKHIGNTYDLAGCEPLTYIDMMKETAKHLGKKRYFFKVPFFTPTLSRLWVSLITHTSRDLVYPLVDSLKHPMVARKEKLFSESAAHGTYSQLIENDALRTHPGHFGSIFKVQRKTVRSVQRLPLPEGKNAQWVKDDYVHWLPRFLRPFIKVKLKENSVVFSIFTERLNLLELNFSPDRSDMDRQLLYIIKGLLVSENHRGRLEFRVVLNRRFILAAIHDYKPAFPWFIYVFTQAKVHLFVMRAFAKRLRRIALK